MFFYKLNTLFNNNEHEDFRQGGLRALPEQNVKKLSTKLRYILLITNQSYHFPMDSSATVPTQLCPNSAGQCWTDETHAIIMTFSCLWTILWLWWFYRNICNNWAQICVKHGVNKKNKKQYKSKLCVIWWYGRKTKVLLTETFTYGHAICADLNTRTGSNFKYFVVIAFYRCDGYVLFLLDDCVVISD